MRRERGGKERGPGKERESGDVEGKRKERGGR